MNKRLMRSIFAVAMILCVIFAYSGFALAKNNAESNSDNGGIVCSYCFGKGNMKNNGDPYPNANAASKNENSAASHNCKVCGGTGYVAFEDDSEGTTDPSNPGTTDPSNPGTTDPSNPGTTDPSNPGTTDPSNPGTTDPSNPGTTDPSNPGTTDPSNPGTTDPSNPGTTDPSNPGTTDPTPVVPGGDVTDPTDPTDPEGGGDVIDDDLPVIDDMFGGTGIKTEHDPKPEPPATDNTPATNGGGTTVNTNTGDMFFTLGGTAPIETAEVKEAKVEEQPQKEIMIEDEDTPLANIDLGEEESNGFPWWIIAVAVVVLGGLFFIVGKRRREEEN